MTDFLKNYTDFEVCSVSVDMLYEDENGKLYDRIWERVYLTYHCLSL